MKKTLPIGEDDFRIIRELEQYYVDKTLMIKDFIEYGNKVTLITRPRRFGKTLNMTMLRDFFDATQDSREIFEGLAIMRTAHAERMNTVPVVSLSLKGCSGKTVEDLETAIAEDVRKEYVRYEPYLMGVDRADKRYSRYFQTLEVLEYEGDEKERNKHLQNNLIYLKNSLAYLIEALYTFYGVRPIVLIDEYDSPIIEAHQGGFREEFSSFYSTFLTVVLKGNPHLGQAMLTGIQRVAKESIFSKLNNIVVYTVLSEHYCQYFGLTSEETGELLDYYDVPSNDEVKSYYNGYLFSGRQIYNPWSILNYANEKKLRSYWLNTSTNSLIREFVLEAGESFHRAFEKLIKNEEVTVMAILEAAFAELPETATLWGLLVNAGYLTVLHEDYEFETLTVRVPNREVRSEFQAIVSLYTKLSNQRLRNMLIALTKGEMDEFFEIYKELVIESTSYHDAKENAYHMLMLGMSMNLRDIYDITSNIESGYGRSDLILKSKDAKRPHIIIEFKQGEGVEKLKYEALQQIKDKKYYAGLTGETLLIGLAHDKKMCQLVHEVMEI